MSTPTPETFAAFADYHEGRTGKKQLYDRMAQLEQQRDNARKDADDLAEALYCFNDVGLCKAFHDQQKSALTSHAKLCKLEGRRA